jgi:charged multivesicular body protein 4
MLALEQMNVTREVLQASKSAASEMKSMTAALGGTEGVERLQEDIEDGMADANEIQEAMSRQMDLPGVEGMDDDDLLAELEGLEEEELTAELSKVELAAPSAGVAMPAVPMSQPLPSAGTHAISAEEEDELAALERSMAM